MIRLTNSRKRDINSQKKQIIINADSIESLESGYDETIICTKGGNEFHVSESPEEVARKVLEWKLAMINYGAAYASLIREEGSTNYEVDAQRDMLKLLAGLEVEL
jgi:uncharacterized protein YlzI (FlbEa/FlbD family)